MSISIELLVGFGTLLIAAVAIIAEIHRSRVQSKTQYTIELLQGYFNGVIDLDTLFRLRKTIPVLEDNSVSHEEDVAISKALNYYDFLALLILKNKLDKKLIIDYTGLTMKRMWEWSRGFVEEDRKKPYQEKLWQSLEKLYETELKNL